MVLNKLSLSEHMHKESMRNVMAGTKHSTIINGNYNEDDDDHTETTFSIDDSFLGIHDDSLKSHHSDTAFKQHNGGLSTLPESDNGSFEKVPMRWLASSTTMPKKAEEEDEDDEEELDMRDLMKESRTMSDCSFKPHESLDSLGWEDMRNVMRKTGRVKSNRSFRSHQRRHHRQQHHESMRSEDGWGSMRDLSIQEGNSKRFSCSDQSASMNDSSFFEYLGDSLLGHDSTFGRNIEFLQQQAKDITSAVRPTGIFVRNMETLSMMFFMGGGGRTQ